MGRAWTPLGALLEALGAKQSSLGSALGRPEGTEETVFKLIGGQIPSQNEPRRVPNRGPKTIRAENSKTLFFDDNCRDSNDFLGLRLSIWSKNRTKMGSESYLRRGSPQKAS